MKKDELVQVIVDSLKTLSSSQLLEIRSSIDQKLDERGEGVPSFSYGGTAS